MSRTRRIKLTQAEVDHILMLLQADEEDGQYGCCPPDSDVAEYHRRVFRIRGKLKQAVSEAYDE